MGVKSGDGMNRALVHGIIHGCDFHQTPVDDTEDITEAGGDRLGLGLVELALGGEPDAEHEVRSK